MPPPPPTIRACLNLSFSTLVVCCTYIVTNHVYFIGIFVLLYPVAVNILYWDINFPGTVITLTEIFLLKKNVGKKSIFLFSVDNMTMS